MSPKESCGFIVEAVKRLEVKGTKLDQIWWSKLITSGHGHSDLIANYPGLEGSFFLFLWELMAVGLNYLKKIQKQLHVVN